MLNFPQKEKEILEFWQKNRIFEKLRKRNKGKKPWSFLDGPITANNPMGAHHAWGRTYKDLFQRYKAMQGFDQRFQNGFDCQGLWVEVEVEKELGFKTKKDIEKYGIDRFVEKCKERVKKYSNIQTEQSIRLGQWMDWDNSYYTMSDENNYAIWSFLKKCYEKKYLYKGRDSVPWCPRCGTAISQHEILAEEYKLITHKAIYFKLPIIDDAYKGTSFLVWTTTPWTIPANVALVVNPDFEYGIFYLKTGGEKLILLKDLGPKILGEDHSLEKTIKGKDLKGLRYIGPFDSFKRVDVAKESNSGTFHTVVLDKDLVTAEEGTGIVHTAPGAGEEDFKISQRENLAVIEVIGESASYLGGLGDFEGKNAKQNPEMIFDYLKKCDNGKFFFKLEDYQHRYPTCWRCKEELVWRVVDEWYIKMDGLREKLVEVSKKIKWIPDFGLARELDWLKNMKDWLISKKRYWGLALPVYECSCGNFEVIGSKEELKERAVEGWEKFEGNSPHKPWIDFVKIKCGKCGNTISRILDVGNPWLDAGIVSFSTISGDNRAENMPYFHNNKKEWQRWFPVDLICESFPGQFKNWFYSLIVMSVVLENTNPVKTIFGYASVRDEKGEEMHKSKGNAIWFDEAVEKVGADPMRWLYMKQNPAENLLFGYKAIEETKRKLLNLFNSFAFFTTYVKKEEIKNGKINPKNILDTWIVSRLNNLIEKTTKSLDAYNPSSAATAIEYFFINDLSLWYIRRSREKFREKKEEVVAVLYHVLLNLAKIIAPIMPLFAEYLYLELKTEGMSESIHLENWPECDKARIDNNLEEKMEKAREIVALALAQRAEKGIKVRQPLASLKLKTLNFKQEKELIGLIKDEVNVKEVVFDKNIEKEVELDFNITEELKKEGMAREMIRKINDIRKEKGFTPRMMIDISASTPYVEIRNILMEKTVIDSILKGTLAKKFRIGEKIEEGFDLIEEKEIDGKKVIIAIKKRTVDN